MVIIDVQMLPVKDILGRTAGKIYWIRQLKAVFAAQIKGCTACFVLVVKYIICRLRCNVIEASVPLLWFPGTYTPVLVIFELILWPWEHAFPYMGTDGVAYAKIYSYDCLEISEFWLKQQSGSTTTILAKKSHDSFARIIKCHFDTGLEWPSFSRRVSS